MKSTNLMTVGQLSARTGLSAKAIRELEGRGLIYTAGRSPANYRLFDESALWCVQVIGSLRALGLTIKEIEALAGSYFGRTGQPVGAHLGALLDRVERRIEDRIGQLQQARRRVRAFRRQHATDVDTGELPPLASFDPRLTFPPG